MFLNFYLYSILFLKTRHFFNVILNLSVEEIITLLHLLSFYFMLLFLHITLTSGKQPILLVY